MRLLLLSIFLLANVNVTQAQTDIPGCTNSFACNYDPEATVDDGSCDFASCISFGCTHYVACNYDEEADYDDGSCEYTSCEGCMNPLACDFDSSATISGICTDFESCYGCMESSADNYDPTATINDYCEFAGCLNSNACNFDSEANVDDGSCEFTTCAGCMSVDACDYDDTATINNGNCTYPDYGYDCDGNCINDSDGNLICDEFEDSSDNSLIEQYVTDYLIGNGIQVSNITYTGGEEQIGYIEDLDNTIPITSGIALSTDNVLNLTDPDCGNNLCDGCTGSGFDQDLLDVANSVPPLIGQSFSVSSVNDICVLEFDFIAIGDSISFNYIFGSDEYLEWVNSSYNDIFAFFISGPGISGPYSSPDYLPEGAINIAQVPNSDPLLPITISSVNDQINSEYYIDNSENAGICIDGYTQEFTASSPVQCGELYHIKIAIADGSDIALESIVLIKEGSFTSNSNTDVNQSSCDCEGNEINGDGVCGCIFEFACNYNPEATIDDGSCEFVCYGCTDPNSCNYDMTANTDDDSCEYLSCLGCMDNIACNYDEFATIEGECIYPDENYNCDEECLNDSDADGICDELEIYGCTEPTACNYSTENTEEDNSCEYETCSGCLYELACNYDPDATIADNTSCEFGTCLGCTDSEACNYNPTVIGDDGSCEYCSCNECVSGCTDIDACNYDVLAINDDGSCEYYDECGICGGNGIENGNCDCDGNQLDAIGNCGGGCWGDFNSNGICDNEEVLGCTYEDANNYNAEATVDDGSCIYESGETGCTYSEAINYNSSAQIDDGSCDFEEQEVSCQSDLNGNGSVGSEDLLLFLADYDTLCE